MSASSSPIASHRGPSAGGGGLGNVGTMSISNSTIAYNSAPSGQGGGFFNGGSVFNGATVSLSGNIVADKTGGGCLKTGGGKFDQGYNPSSENSCGLTRTGRLPKTETQPCAPCRKDTHAPY